MSNRKFAARKVILISTVISALSSASVLFVCTTSSARADLLGDIVGDQASDNKDTRADALFKTRDIAEAEIEIEDKRDALRLRRRQLLDDQKKAGDGGSLYDKFDGAEFKKQSFIDTDFRRNPFRDLYKSNLTPPHQSDLRRRSDDSRDHDDKSDDETDDVEKTRKKVSDQLKMKAKQGDLRDWKEVTKPVPYILHDWVPDSPDPLHNGGFVKMPFNGSPVPYRLNGHMDPERNLPWAKGD